MAWLCGWRLRLVSTLEEGDTAGRVTFYDRGPQGQSVIQQSTASAPITVAGEVAYAIQLGCIDPQDMRLWVEHHNELPPKFPSAWLDPLLIGVRDDLQANWPRVEALAEALLDRLSLSGKKATAVIAAAVAGERERWPLAGDQLYVDLDISRANLPPGSWVQMGSAVIEFSESPHTGTAKFSARFGVDALKFVNTPEGRDMRLRGANCRVVVAGRVRKGDVIRKLPKG
jgi:hypothetical protein